jgi:hypothetical protein
VAPRLFTFAILIAPVLLHAQQPDCRVRTAEDFVPMTRTERAAYYVQSIVGPEAFLYSAVRAGGGQGIDRPREYGQGMEGFGLRMGSAYAERTIGQTFEHGFALGRHEDNRYFSSGKRGFGPRLAYAFSSAFLARHDDGSRGLSLSTLGGTAVGAFVSRTWQPRSTTSLADGGVSFGITLGLRAGFNVIREFAPGSVKR